MSSSILASELELAFTMLVIMRVAVGGLVGIMSRRTDLVPEVEVLDWDN